MYWTAVMILASYLCFVRTENKVNGTLPDSPKSAGNSSGVCKADYNSKFNIDSKELGTTCVSKGRYVSKLIISNKLRHAVEKMKQDFQHLQDLIDQETQSVEDNASLLSSNADIWKGETLTVHRNYQDENENADKVVRYSDHLRESSPPRDASKGTNQGPATNMRETYFGTGESQDFQPMPLNQYCVRYDNKVSNREESPSFEYDSRAAYQQRALPNTSLEFEESYRSDFLNQQPGKCGKLTENADLDSSNASY